MTRQVNSIRAADDVDRKMRERNAHFACPMCKFEKWGTTGDEVFLPGLDEKKSVALICLNCGFVRWHAVEGLDGQLVGLAKASDDDE